MTARAAIRGAFGVALTLVTISVGSLWASATYTRAVSPALGPHPFAALPVFFNAHPVDVETLADLAVQRIVLGGALSPAAEQALVRLGGAALPRVLPALDALAPESRERVALALAPVAVRMGIATADELADGPRAVLFWTRFWQDRAVDFRPDSVRRASARLAERALPLRREDVIHVDTFALPWLMEGLGRVETPADVTRVARLSSVIAHVTARPEPHAAWDLERARSTTEAWRAFWAVHGREYTKLGGPRKLAAMFLQTQYGKWLSSVRHGATGGAPGGAGGWSAFLGAIAVTCALLFPVMASGFSLGFFWARRVRGIEHRRTRRSLVAGGLLLAVLPYATAVGLVGGEAGLVVASCAIVLGTAAWVSRHLAASGLARSSQLRPRAPFAALTPLAVSYPPCLLSAVVALELGFGLHGVGGVAARSLISGDTDAWMASSLTLSVLSLLLRYLAESLPWRQLTRPEAERVRA